MQHNSSFCYPSVLCTKRPKMKCKQNPTGSGILSEAFLFSGAGRSLLRTQYLVVWPVRTSNPAIPIRCPPQGMGDLGCLRQAGPRREAVPGGRGEEHSGVPLAVIHSTRWLLTTHWAPATWRPPWNYWRPGCSPAWPSTNSLHPWVSWCLGCNLTVIWTIQGQKWLSPSLRCL